LAEYPKLLFYGLLPVILASFVWRHMPELQASGFWLAAIVAMILLKRLSHEVFRIEVTLLVGLAIFSLKSVVLNQLAFSLALINVGFGLVFFILLLRLNNAFDRKLADVAELSSFFPVAYHYFSFALFLLVFKSTLSLGLAAAAAGYLNLVYCYRQPSFTPIRTHLRQFYALALMLAWAVASGMLTQTSRSGVDVSLTYSFVLAMMVCFHRRSAAARILHRGAAQLWLMHLLWLVACSTWLQRVAGEGVNAYVSIALIVQASFVLIMTLNHRLYENAAKLSIAIFAVATLKIFMFDLKESSMFEKMVAMIGIGVVLLLSGYMYQKLKLQFDQRKAVARD
ncbi:MAG TPA: hypothetical protein VFM46_18675, partial [Pseudomonadales bacterium]|nr:hypothetical protein [Pseudomonadales bacterium]